MNKKIGDALKKVGLPVYFIHSDQNCEECIVFNYSYYPCLFADNEQKGNIYTILINLRCGKSVKTYTDKIVSVMLENGFKQNTIQPTQLEKIENGSIIYNTALTFKIYEERRNSNE